MTTVPNDRHLPVSRCLSVDLEVTKQDQRIRAFAGVRWDSGESFIFPGTGDRLAQALAKLDDLALGADFLQGSLSPLAFAATTRTVYSVPSASSVRVAAYRSRAEVDCSLTMLVAGSLESCRDESYSSAPDFHWILNEVVDATSDEDQRTSIFWLSML